LLALQRGTALVICAVLDVDDFELDSLRLLIIVLVIGVARLRARRASATAELTVDLAGRCVLLDRGFRARRRVRLLLPSTLGCRLYFSCGWLRFTSWRCLLFRFLVAVRNIACGSSRLRRLLGSLVFTRDHVAESGRYERFVKKVTHDILILLLKV